MYNNKHKTIHLIGCRHYFRFSKIADLYRLKIYIGVSAVGTLWASQSYSLIKTATTKEETQYLVNFSMDTTLTDARL